jgi:hypothetical protein
MRSVAPVVASTTTLMDPAAIERLVGPRDPQTRGFIETAEVVRAIVMIAARVIKRIVTKRAHGIYTTIVEETLREFYLANVGGKIWAMMKQDTADSFAPDPVEFGGTAVLTELAAAMRGGGYPKITLVGHSTGAVYISHWLQAADALLPHELQFDVVLLAPASTGALMAETLNQHGHRIRGFRMFSMTDEHERSDRLVPVLYPRSLLYFVSGVVETTADTPVAGMQRFYDSARYEPGEFPDVDTARRFFGQGAHRVVWSVAQDGLGRNTASISHGDFDNDTATIASLRHILMSGF